MAMDVYGLWWTQGKCCFVSRYSNTQGWFGDNSQKRFTIAEEKSKYLHHLKELIKDYYEPVTDLRRSNNGENRLNDMDQHSEEEQEEHEMDQVILIDDESDEL